MKTALIDAKSNLTTAQQQMKRAVDKKRRTEEYKIGEEVVLSTINLRTYCPNLPPKIKARWVGPFCIQKIVSPIAFGLDLPLGWWIHPVFHTSKLKRYIRSEEFLREVEPPSPVLVGDTLEYEVEGILRHQGTGTRRQHLVLWKGYPLTEATWEPESHLTNAPYILEKYLHRVEAQNRGKRHTGGVPSRR